MNQRGFSLISALVTVGLLSIVSLAVGGIIKLTNDSKLTVENFQEVSSYEVVVKKSLSRPQVCKSNFLNKLMPDVGAQLAITALWPTDSSGNLVTTGQPLYADGMTYGKITTVRAFVETVHQVSGIRYFGNFIFEMTDRQGRAYRRSFPLLFTVLSPTDKRIQTCSDGVDLSVTLSEKVCYLSSNGEKFYDENLTNPDGSTGGCRSRYEFQDVVGDDTATCPSGWQLASDENHWIACGYQGTDLAQEQLSCGTRTYVGITDPIVSCSPPYMATVDPATQSCTCIWAVDAPPGNRCVAHCRRLISY